MSSSRSHATLGDCLDGKTRRELGFPVGDPSNYATLGDFLDANPMRRLERPAMLVFQDGVGVAGLDGKAFAAALLSSPQFRLYVLNGLAAGDLPGSVVIRLMDNGWGKPVDRLEVKDTTDPLDDLSAEQLEDRAARLLEVARQLRTNDEANRPMSEPDDGPAPSSVH